MELDRYTLTNLSDYIFNSYYDNWWSSSRSKDMGDSTLAVGVKYEKEVEKRYQNEGYRTHRMVKSKYGKQDFLHIFHNIFYQKK